MNGEGSAEVTLRAELDEAWRTVRELRAYEAEMQQAWDEAILAQEAERKEHLETKNQLALARARLAVVEKERDGEAARAAYWKAENHCTLVSEGILKESEEEAQRALAAARQRLEALGIEVPG